MTLTMCFILVNMSSNNHATKSCAIWLFERILTAMNISNRLVDLFRRYETHENIGPESVVLESSIKQRMKKCVTDWLTCPLARNLANVHWALCVKLQAEL